MANPNSTHVSIMPAYLRRLRPDPAGDLIKRDDDITGFGVRVKPTGSMSLFIEARVSGTGKQRRKTIANLDPGNITDQAVREARSEAMQLLGQWKGGTDTVKAERQAGKLPTVQQTLDRYLAVRKLKASTKAEYQMLLNTHLKPVADSGIDTITPGQVKALHEAISTTPRAAEKAAVGRRKPQRRRPSPARADAAMRVLRALWNFAWSDNIDDATGQSKLTGKNPVDVLSGVGQWHGTEPKKSHVTKGSFKRWHAAVMDLKPERCTSRSEIVRDLFLFCVYTGVRLQEALDLTAEQVNLDAKTFTMLNTKNGADFTLPASAPAYEILKRRAVDGLVFPIKKSSLVEYRRRVTEASGVQFSVHDLRRTFATHARDIGLAKGLIGELLNHKTGRDVTAGYISQSPEPYRKPMAEIAAHFRKLAK